MISNKPSTGYAGKLSRGLPIGVTAGVFKKHEHVFCSNGIHLSSENCILLDKSNIPLPTFGSGSMVVKFPQGENNGLWLGTCKFVGKGATFFLARLIRENWFG